MRKILMAVALVSVGACGDNDTNDHRGYTKAPLEEPTVLIRAEEASPMAALGDPIYPEAPMIEAEEEQEDNVPGAGEEVLEERATVVPEGATQGDVDEGTRIFSTTGNCFTCHGQNGTGGPLAPALNDSEWLNIDGSFASIQQVVKAGVPQPKQHPAPMPPMGGAQLTDAQVKQVAAYVYSISH